MLKEKKINAGQWSEVVVKALLNLGHKWSEDEKIGKYVYINPVGNIYSDSIEFEYSNFNEMSVAGVLRYASTELISRKIDEKKKFNSVPEELLGRDFDEKNRAADAFAYGLNSGPYLHGYVIPTGGRRSGRTFGLEELLEYALGKDKVIVDFNPRGRHWLHQVMGTLDTPRKPETTPVTDFYYNGLPVLPFDRVLVRDGKVHNWRAVLFSHINKGEIFPYVSSSGTYKECIPYKGNEILLGTTKNP